MSINKQNPNSKPNSKSIGGTIKDNKTLSDNNNNNNNATQSNQQATNSQQVNNNANTHCIKQIPLVFNPSRTQSKKTTTVNGDRFIPQRPKPKEEQLNYYCLMNKAKHINTHHQALNTMILDALCYNNYMISVDLNSIRNIKQNKERLLSFNSKPITTQGTITPGNKLQMQQHQSNNLLSQVNTIIEKEYINQQYLNDSIPIRHIPLTPYKILDAPKLIDDFYLNLLDWGSRNVIAVALETYVYLWNSETMNTVTLCQDKDNISSVKWMDNGTCLAIGLNDGSCDLYDVEQMTRIRKMEGHSNRVSSIDIHDYYLTTGSKDNKVINHDIRVHNHITSVLNFHSKEVCALKWSTDGRLLASGGNDNMVYIWDVNKAQEHIDLFRMSIEGDDSNSHSHSGNTSKGLNHLFKFDYHKAAVKALAWCPFQRHLLATGGGAKDNTIQYWNCDSGLLIKSIDTGSQVCSLLWNPLEKELLSSHGYSKNQIVIWSYSNMTRICELIGHRNRVLYMSMSPDGCCIVSGAGDESIRLWRINDDANVDANAKIDNCKDNANRQCALNEINLR